MNVTLRVGAMDLSPKEQTVLRSLIQMLDGQTSCQLKYHGEPQQCAVVFVPADWPRRLPAQCITVRVSKAGTEVPIEDSDGFIVASPLRLSEVRAVLEVASDIVSNSMQAAASEGVRAVFVALARHVMSRERRVTALRLTDGNRLVVDFAKGLVHSTMPHSELLAGMYVMEPAQRAEPGEEREFDQANAWNLRELLWNLAVYLGDAGVEGTAFQSAYRMVRRPPAELPMRPEYARLVAVLSAQACTLPRACELSGATRWQVQWFFETCFALGLIVPAGEGEALAAVPSPAPESKPLLERIATRLKGR